MKLNMTSQDNGQNYSLWIDSYSIEDLVDKIHEVLESSSVEKISIITDSKINSIYMNPLEDEPLFPLDQKLVNSGYEITKIVLPEGEACKSQESLLDILSILNENNFTKMDLIIAFGGGTIGDISGLAANLYMRGCSLILLPTTLLSMIDSCLGGKNGINFARYKNLIGTIYEPLGVIINTNFIETLDDNQIQSGRGEVLKYKILKNLSLFKDMEHNVELSWDPNNYSQLIYNCLKIKSILVEKDKFDFGIRRFLNLGHTFGHALEAKNDFSLSHGQGVAIGIYLASLISKNLGYVDEAYVNNIKMEVLNLGLSLDIDLSSSYFAKALLKDKKAEGSRISFVLPHNEKGAIIEKFQISELISLVS